MYIYLYVYTYIYIYHTHTRTIYTLLNNLLYAYDPTLTGPIHVLKTSISRDLESRFGGGLRTHFGWENRMKKSILVEFHVVLVDFHLFLVEFHVVLVDFHLILVGFHVILVDYHLILVGFHSFWWTILF